MNWFPLFWASIFTLAKKRGWTTKLPKPLCLFLIHFNYSPNVPNVFQVPNLVSCARGRQGSHIMILWGKGTGRKVLMYFLMTGHQDRCRPLPFPTPLDMRTAVLMSFPSWLWHIYLMQRAASMQNTTASINIIRIVQLAGDILAAAKCTYRCFLHSHEILMPSLCQSQQWTRYD